MAAVLETRLRHAQTEKLAPIDLASNLVSDELLRRQDRLLERRHKQARFRDPDRSLDTFDFDFNKKMTLLDRLLHHAHMLKCGPRSWRTKVRTGLRTKDATK
jgi:hypothetical protein